MDGSLGNPILQSQGIPQIKINSGLGYKYHIISFENSRLLSPNEKKFYLNSFDSLRNIAEIIVVKVPIRFKPIRYLLILLLGSVKSFICVKRNQIEIIHCRSNFPTIIGLIVKIFTKVNVVFDDRGLLSEEIQNKGINFRAQFEKINEKICLRFSDRIVVVSDKFREYLINKYCKVFPDLKNKIIIINNAFDSARVNYSEVKRYELRNKYNIENRILMTYSGKIVKWQMFDEIVEIFKILKVIQENALLMVITPDTDEAETILNEKAINKNDYQIQTAIGNELGELLIQGDFGVLIREQNIINRVSSPIKFSEYLAAGLPVLISEGIGDTEQLIRKSGVGIITKIRDKNSYNISLKKMLILLSDRSIKSKCVDVAEMNLSMIKSAEKYRGIYNQLVVK
jgi:hypothetical protein